MRATKGFHSRIGVNQETLFVVVNLTENPNYVTPHDLITDSRWLEYTVTLCKQDQRMFSSNLKSCLHLICQGIRSQQITRFQRSMALSWLLWMEYLSLAHLKKCYRKAYNGETDIIKMIWNWSREFLSTSVDNGWLLRSHEIIESVACCLK